MTAKRSDVILNTDSHRPARDQFIEHMNNATRREGWRAHETVSYWLEAAFRSMRGAVTIGEARDKNEDEYMKIVKRCRHPSETMQDLSSMLGALIMAIEAAPVDFIGPIFSEFASSGSLGQFFTPYHVSKVMAAMIIEEPEKMLADSGRGFITLQEPACGVGGMVLAASEVLCERGFDLARQIHWTMVDIDFSAICAAYLQTNLCGISADVIHGNTLSLQTWLTTPTLAAVMHPKRFPKTDAHPSLPSMPPNPDVTIVQRKADAPLKPKKPQAPLDFGLFGDSHLQTDLIDMAGDKK